MTRLALRCLIFGLGLLLVSAPVMLAPAQDTLDPGKEKAFLGGMKDKLDGKENGRLSELRLGNKDLADEGDFNRQVLQKAAKYYVYRVTEPRFWGSGDDEKDPAKTAPITMNDIVKDASIQLLLPDIRRRATLKEGQVKYLDKMSEEMLKCLREVFSHNSEPICRVNAGRILALVAETGQEKTAEIILPLLANPREKDAVKFWALKALHELLASGKPLKNEEECVLAAQAFLTRKVDIPEDPQEREALNYVRREAVRALASSRYAVVPKNPAEKGQTALWLLRVARKDGFPLVPSLSEQVEAAIGACQLAPNKDAPGKDLQMDVVAYHVGKVIVEFANEYSKQRGGNEGAGLPWKLYSTKLTLALDELQAHAKGNKYVDDMTKRARDVLKPIDVGKEAAATTLEDWLKDNKPKNGAVYSGVAESEIKGE